MVFIHLILYACAFIIKCEEIIDHTMFIKDINEFNLEDGIQIQFNSFKSSSINNNELGTIMSASIDFNNDIKNDIILCLPFVNVYNRINAGICYIILNQLAFNHALDNIVLNDNLDDPFKLGFRILGGASNDNFGFSVNNAGYFNNDLMEDIIIGAPYGDPIGRTNAGIVYLIFGQDLQGSQYNILNDIDLSQNPFNDNNNLGMIIYGATASDNLGFSVSTAKNFHHNRFLDTMIYDDIVIGAPGNAIMPGSVYIIYYTKNYLLDLAIVECCETRLKIVGQTPNDHFGYSVSYMDDMNKDGYNDILIGAYGADPEERNNAGVVYIIYGGSINNNLDTSRVLLNSLEYINDVYLSYLFIDKSSIQQKIIEPQQQQILDQLSKKILFIQGANTYDSFGKGLINLGDIDNDGYSDIIISAVGKVYILYGPVKESIKIDDNVFNNKKDRMLILFNTKRFLTIGKVGDINEDFYSDIVICDSNYDESYIKRNSGICYILLGETRDHMLHAYTLSNNELISNNILKIKGAKANDNFGSSFGTIKDYNNDGINDFFISSKSKDSNEKRSYLFYGKDTNHIEVNEVELLNNQKKEMKRFNILGLDDPTTNPTTTPTTIPTTIPTTAPTTIPTTVPSTIPTTLPTTIPTTTPTTPPTTVPTTLPTTIPTTTPTTPPTTVPTTPPTTPPTTIPTQNPTTAPTCSPTTSPTTSPTCSPSCVPSALPTSQPSIQPSSIPSMQPSRQPTLTPTVQPSIQPSTQPSIQPSVQPSVQPSTQPSSRPTMQPSVQPSMQPSGQPSIQPSIQPSNQPSTQPTIQPSNQPSMQPSIQPSTQPTIQPSNQPSMQPSTQPSGRPSMQPSVQPSMQPSGQPSSQPSMQPSNQPSTQPTIQPSNQPSMQPSSQPSSRPTMQPSGQPSMQPSIQPSNQPSMQPSVQPSNQPTEQPSNQPSMQPSSQPSSQPSMQPSVQPSMQPSGQPSSQPSMQPSNQPSSQPTIQPSNQPSMQPSSQPSSRPTMQPSVQPSMQPSSQPTMIPSMQPSTQPSMQPSNQPSVQPSMQPSIQPSMRPSCQPTDQPSMQPSSQPSVQPSSQPSLQPSMFPSSQPTIQPTMQPSNQPSMQPSSQPTTQPSIQPSIQPSMQPSGQPSSVPSMQPSSQPSTQPSSQPSEQPSMQPSFQPTTVPSMQPSIQPSIQPSSQPSSNPSMQPSIQPSIQPSGQPSSIPSTQPSNQPSGQPSLVPTNAPSYELEANSYKVVQDSIKRVRNHGMCNNLCSGHGICEKNTNCNCFLGHDGNIQWMGADCSLRTCPRDIAWIGSVVNANDLHPKVECSNRGLCDRKTGFCDCFDGYDGIACQRNICPDNCNYRGVCFPEKMLAEKSNRIYTIPWDSMKSIGCICDIGYRGPACEYEECPSGPDPIDGFGNEVGRDCSGRGICNYNIGLCKCFKGFYGNMCQHRITEI